MLSKCGGTIIYYTVQVGSAIKEGLLALPQEYIAGLEATPAMANMELPRSS